MSQNSPVSIDDLSDSFLTQILRQTGAISKSSVAGHEIVNLPEPGQTTDMAFIALSYDEAEADAPSRLTAKFAVAHPEALAFSKDLGIYEREVGFYQKIGKDAGVPVPGCYYGEHDEASGDFLLLLEDLTGNLEGNFVTPDMEMVDSLVIYSAKMHSRWWQSKSLNQYPWLNTARRIQQLTQRCLSTADTFLEKMGEYLNPYFLRITDAIIANPRAMDHTCKGPLTLFHGDLHVKNAFFASNGHPIFIDWQFAGVGNPTIDIIRPFVTVPTEDQEGIPDLLRRYLEELHAGGVTDYSMAQLKEDIIVGLLYSWALEMPALAETDVGILDDICRSNNSSLTDVYGRMGDLGERFGMAEFIEKY